MSIPQRIFVPIFLFLLALAAFLRFWALDAGLPHLMTRPDEELILFQTRDPASGIFHLQWVVMHPGIPSAYIYLLWVWGELGLNLLQAVGAAPAGDYLHLLNAAPDRLLLIERAFSACAGVATVAVVALGARRELGGGAALVAGLLVATAFLHVRDSHSAKPDIAMGLGFAAALVVMAPLWNGVRLGRVIATGVVIGAGMAMKPPAVLLFVPAWLALFMGSEQKGWRRLSISRTLLLALSAAVVFTATSPFFVLSGETFERVVKIVGIVFPEIAPAEVAPAIPVIPGLEKDPSRLAGIGYHVRFSLRYGVGLVMTLLLPFAVARAFLVRSPLLVSSAVLFLLGVVVFGLSPALLSRYITPLVPAAALLVGGLLAGIAERLPMRSRATALAALALIVAAEPTIASVRFDRLATLTDTRVYAARWLDENTEDDATIAVAGTVLWSWGEPTPPTGRDWVRIELDDGELDRSGASILVTHDHTLFSSTIDPGSLTALRPRLDLLAEFDPFSADGPEPMFETLDAYYIPTRGFAGLERPGPVVRIYAVR
ncbi:MAG: glycosyltransferase family 39 protein [Candidatus Binatia bacterium]|nr:glycosyltransferase family 39 protein [Candidatus Binatia bacterium]